MTKPSRKIRALGTDVDEFDLQGAVSLMQDWLKEIRQGNAGESVDRPPCRFVVTPNLDHAVKLRSSADFRAAYAAAALTLADGMPLVWTARLFGQQLKARVAGSDFVPAVLATIPPGTRVYLLGASEASSQKAAENIERSYPNARVVGRMSPPFGFETSEDWSSTIVTDIVSTKAELIILGLGAPKQELWIARHAARLPGTVAICAGATIDFLAGAVARAPEWAQKSGVEWVHRMLSDPRRLVKRYAWDMINLPLLVIEDAIYHARGGRREP